jgi:hypothetical protein
LAAGQSSKKGEKECASRYESDGQTETNGALWPV